MTYLDASDVCFVRTFYTLEYLNNRYFRTIFLEVKLYCHGPVGTTGLSSIERCPLFGVSFKRGSTVSII